MEFKGKVAIVTGGGSGIGRAAALALAAEGATVVVAGRSAEPLDETVALIAEAGGAASPHAADVTVSAEIEGLIAQTVARHGRLDIAFNNAGVLSAAPLADTDEADWDRLVAVNLTGVFLAMKHEIAHMRAADGGVIVNTASNIGAHQRRAGMAAYVATKAAVSALTRGAALDHIADGVRINVISPGPTETTMSLRPGESEADRAQRLTQANPSGRAATVDEIVAAVLWLCSPRSSYVVGHDLVVDGGATA